jgi:hypothetical protein
MNTTRVWLDRLDKRIKVAVDFDGTVVLRPMQQEEQL